MLVFGFSGYAQSAIVVKAPGEAWAWCEYWCARGVRIVALGSETDPAW